MLNLVHGLFAACSLLNDHRQNSKGHIRRELKTDLRTSSAAKMRWPIVFGFLGVAGPLVPDEASKLKDG